MAGVKIKLEGGGKTLEGTTDKEGDFSFSVPGPGTYVVTAVVPFEAFALQYVGDPPVQADATESLTTFKYEVLLEKNQCKYRQLNIIKL